MRVLLARLLVLVTGILVWALAVTFAAIRRADDIPSASAAARDATAGDDAGRALIARGRSVFAEQGCALCHSLTGRGNTRSPLDDVGRRLTPREIRLWITAPQQMDPGVSKAGYRLSDDDLDALVAYLQSPGGTPQ